MRERLDHVTGRLVPGHVDEIVPATLQGHRHQPEQRDASGDNNSRQTTKTPQPRTAGREPAIHHGASTATAATGRNTTEHGNKLTVAPPHFPGHCQIAGFIDWQERAHKQHAHYQNQPSPTQRDTALFMRPTATTEHPFCPQVMRKRFQYILQSCRYHYGILCAGPAASVNPGTARQCRYPSKKP